VPLGRVTRRATVVGPVAGGYLRPWMSAADPVNSDILIVGANAATPFRPTIVERDRYIELLLAGGAELRELYANARASRGPSPTRRNIDRASQILLAHRARGVLETMSGLCRQSAWRISRPPTAPCEKRAHGSFLDLSRS
jgi:hypothetical protein